MLLMLCAAWDGGKARQRLQASGGVAVGPACPWALDYCPAVEDVPLPEAATRLCPIPEHTQPFPASDLPFPR